MTAALSNGAGARGAANVNPNNNGNGNNNNNNAPNGVDYAEHQYNQQLNQNVTNAANTAANGLFLLSQAHQELTKREEAQRASANGLPAPVSANGSSKRGTKRKSYDASIAPPPPEPPKAQPKRTRSNTVSSRKISEEMDSDDMDDDMDDMMDDGMGKGEKGSRSKKPETEEEKRKNFLERNRQGSFCSSNFQNRELEAHVMNLI